MFKSAGVVPMLPRRKPRRSLVEQPRRADDAVELIERVEGACPMAAEALVQAFEALALSLDDVATVAGQKT